MISAVSRDADGGGGGGGAADPAAAAPAAPCAKAREDRKGKNVIRGWKRDRDRDRDRCRRDGSPPPAPPPSVFLPSSGLSEHPLCRDGPGLCRCAAVEPRVPGGDAGGPGPVSGGRAPPDCGGKSGAAALRRTQDDAPANKKIRGPDKVSGRAAQPPPARASPEVVRV